MCVCVQACPYVSVCSKVCVCLCSRVCVSVCVCGDDQRYSDDKKRDNRRERARKAVRRQREREGQLPDAKIFFKNYTFLVILALKITR